MSHCSSSVRPPFSCWAQIKLLVLTANSGNPGLKNGFPYLVGAGSSGLKDARAEELLFSLHGKQVAAFFSLKSTRPSDQRGSGLTVGFGFSQPLFLCSRAPVEWFRTSSRHVCVWPAPSAVYRPVSLLFVLQSPFMLQHRFQFALKRTFCTSL